jgi:NAD+ synthase (glutamine-hydrolysing)
MKIALCQINPVMGDIEGNTAKVVECLKPGRADLFVFPELCIQGYPPRDLLEQPWFVEQGIGAVEKVCRVSESLPGTGIIVGCALRSPRAVGKGLSNSAVLVIDGAVRLRQDKSLLPTYDVFDELRYFDPADRVEVVRFREHTLGITICEDAWNDPRMWRRAMYDFDPLAGLAAKGADLFINISASPFCAGKERVRFELLRRHAARHRTPLVFVNQVGGNDELVFDGCSMVLDQKGDPAARLAMFEESVQVVETGVLRPLAGWKDPGPAEQVYRALVLGVGDYMRKCGFKKALLGLSGGIDSAVTAAIAAEAAGKENVLGITMPSRYSSEGSRSDSKQLAENLGIGFKEIAIEKAFTVMLDLLEPHFRGMKPDTAEENIQARLRGMILMAFSNKFGYLLLSTGNKSESAVGYCTLYGDMNGGLSVISDVPKTMVYELASYINRNGAVIPQRIIDKAPSAELRPCQKDQDTLPPYEVLDGILLRLIEEGKSVDEIAREGFERATVEWVARAVRVNEYKRRQAAPGIKVTSKAFGMGRRFPVAARYEWRNPADIKP